MSWKRGGMGCCNAACAVIGLALRALCMCGVDEGLQGQEGGAVQGVGEGGGGE